MTKGDGRKRRPRKADEAPPAEGSVTAGAVDSLPEGVETQHATREPAGDTVDEARAVVLGEKLLEQAACGIRVEKAADDLGLPHATAYRYFDAAIRRHYTLTPEAKRRQLAIELETLRLVQQAMMPVALRGHVGAGQLVVATSKRRSELTGIDAAIEVSVSTSNVRDAVAEVVTLLEDHAPPPDVSADLPALPPPPAPRAIGA
jgi:hypothetical protein